MTVNPAEQIFEEMLPYLEIPDAQTGGSQLLKDKGITINAAFADYAQPADNPINVRELGMRVRMEYLFSTVAKRIAQWS
jgi:hypothetical protein